MAQFVTALSQRLGTASVDMTGLEQLLPARSTAAAKPSGPSKSFKVKKGQKLKLPSFGKVKAGTYQYKLTLRAGKNTVTLTSALFKLDAKGRMSAVKKATVKPKAKAKTKAKAKPKKKAKKK